MWKRFLFILVVIGALAWIFKPRLQLFSAFHTPIEFYGKILDQHGDVVPNADIKYFANNSIGSRPAEHAAKSDSAGLFSINGIGGLTLAVEVSKPGYRALPERDSKPASGGLFEYGLSSKGPFESHKSSPTIFALYKPGPIEPLVKLGTRSYYFPPGDVPVTATLDEQGHAHRVVLRYWRNRSDAQGGSGKYDWSLEVSVPDGGVLLRPDDFDFEAPGQGYASNDTINMPASLPYGYGGWSSFVRRSYFIRFNDGIFARAKLEMHADGDAFAVLDSFLNPRPGHRNLESEE
ncbi:MAG: carboxypeptidase-like regulatory domain-containing protein [Chthoniobacter sp.]|uniref:carboxypeptidase-like regulatory domain-containing protein n=1 Tax=Chthoniobacter sp. TaxID=2510640 RepID=UPI0032A51B85